jgi:hypothetical protein
MSEIHANVLPKKWEPGTIWKLIEAQCSQLEAAVSNTRTAFFIALSWSFIWAWAIYSVDLGYPNTLWERTAKSYIQSLADAPPEEFFRKCEEKFPDIARTIPVHDADDDASKDRKNLNRKNICKDLAERRFDWIDKGILDATYISYPWVSSKLFVSDLGIVGQLGLFLILSWGFFAIRRENHALRAMVDMDRASLQGRRWAPRRYILSPQEKYLSPEHLAYAYHATANRFQFINSQYSKPLMLFTAILTFLPVSVALGTFGTDIRDVYKFESVSVELVIRLIVEAVFLIATLTISAMAVAIEFNTSVLLNGWHLAVRDVWMFHWDESTQDLAAPVEIDVQSQTAIKAT